MTSRSRVNRENEGQGDEVLLLRRQVAELSRNLTEQVARVEEVAQEAEQFRAVAECTYDVECWFAPSGRLVWINQAIERLTGYSVAECLSLLDLPAVLVCDEDRERSLEAFQSTSQDRCGNDLSFRIRSKTGSSVWVAASWQPMYTPDRRYLGRRLSIRDIRERKAAEQRVIQQGRLLAELLANIPSGVYWKGRDFKYQGCNEAFAHAAGVRRPEDIVGRTDYELAWDVEQADYFRAWDRRVMDEKLPRYNIQETERQADGRQAVLLTSKVPLLDAEGQVCGLLGIDTDISELKRVEAELRQTQADLESRVEERTAELASANRQLTVEIAERCRAEEALRVSQERYRMISELTSDYAYALRRNAEDRWEVEWCSDAFRRFNDGITPQLDPGGNWQGLLHPDDAPMLEHRWQRLRSGYAVTSEYRVVTHDGRHRWLRDRARPLKDEITGVVNRIVGAARDITERRQAEDEVRRHQDALAHVSRLSMLGELTGQLAHELNQPLCTVVGNAQTARRLLSAPVPDGNELCSALDDIVAAAKHAAEVIRRLRSLIRQQESQHVILNLARVIEEITGFVAADARRHGALVRFDVADDMPTVRGDSIQLQQVILNLVRNGLEAMAGTDADARELVVRVVRRGHEALVEIVDRGVGVSAESLRQIFEPFHSTKPAGLGLGLSISRSIIETHGGRLWGESNARGGATFVMALPISEDSDT